MGRGTQLFTLGKYSEALEAMAKATAINPNAGPAYNMIGYAHLFQGEASPAVEALKKYASLAPNEPNPQDSLGEALMANGQFADAEMAFQKAVSLSPQFGGAWEGVAYTKFFRGDWAGGQAAVAKAYEAATRLPERMTAARLAVYGRLAEGQTAKGLKEIDALAKSPDAPITAATALVDRARVLVKAAVIEMPSPKRQRPSRRPMADSFLPQRRLMCATSPCPSPLPPRDARAMSQARRRPSPCFRNWQRRDPTIRLQQRHSISRRVCSPSRRRT